MVDEAEIERAIRSFSAKARDAVLLDCGEPLDPAQTSARSYFGGLPRLPATMEWPQVARREEDGEGEGPIAPTFLCQIDLAALPPVPQRHLLPPKGTVYFFCNTQFVSVGDPACRVLYHPGDSDGLDERQPPNNLMRMGGIYDARLLPQYGDDDVRAKVDVKREMKFRVGPSYPQAYQVGDTDAHELAYKRLAPFDHEGVHPQMLGFAYLTQDIAQYDEDDVLLLQLGSGFGWLDNCGCVLHFWIRPQELAKRQFTNVIATLTCD
jgi:uncharacterized protein YwqG